MEQRVQGKAQTVLNCKWDDSFQQRHPQLEARVGVDLDESHLQVLVHHEVKPKHFVIVGPAVSIEGDICGTDCVMG